MDFSKIDPRCAHACPFCGGAIETDEQWQAYIDLIRSKYEHYEKTYRCLVTGHTVGTDTVMAEGGCDCQVCQLVQENVQLRVELDRPEPSPTWAELENLDAEFERLRRDLNEMALYTSAHHDCLAGDDDCAESQCREVRELLKGYEEPLGDVKERVMKRRQLSTELIHAWCDEPDSSADWFERQVASEQRGTLTQGGDEEE
jgi:hypothetical protein